MGDTDRQSKSKNVMTLWVPIGVMVTVVIFVGGASTIWATDRAALETGKEKDKQHDETISNNSRRLEMLERVEAVRNATDQHIKSQLEDLRKSQAELNEKMQKVLDRLPK